MRLAYFCEKTIDPESGQVILECTNPSAFAFGETQQKAEMEMHSLLLDLVSDYFSEKKLFPMPEDAEGENVPVYLTPIETLKVFLLNAMVETHTRPVDIAQRLGITRQEVTRITNPRYKTKLDTLDRAIESTGKKFVFLFVDGKC